MLTLRQHIKLCVILSMAIFPILVWMLALSSATTPLVAQYGIFICLLFAAAISIVSAWLIIGFIREINNL